MFWTGFIVGYGGGCVCGCAVLAAWYGYVRRRLRPRNYGVGQPAADPRWAPRATDRFTDRKFTRRTDLLP